MSYTEMIIIEEQDGNKYLTLAHAYESKNALIKYGGLWKKITDLIRPTSNKYMKNI